MRPGVLAILVVAAAACSLPKFHGAGDDDDGPMDGRGSGSDGGIAHPHDEDGDHIDDSIDLCPVDPADTLDTDGDHVGDACDPAPSIGGDHAVLYTFATDTGDLIASDPATLEGDTISFGNSTDIGSVQTLWLPNTWSRVRIEVAYEVGALGPQDGTHNYNELALHLGNNGAPDDFTGLACNLERIGLAATTHFYIEQVPGPELAGTMPDLGYPLAGSHGKLIMQDTGELSCTSARDSAGPVTFMFNTGVADGRVGLSAFQLRVRLKYIFVSGL